MRHILAIPDVCRLKLAISINRRVKSCYDSRIHDSRYAMLRVRWPSRVTIVEYHFEEPWSITYYHNMENNFHDVVLMCKLWAPLHRGHALDFGKWNMTASKYYDCNQLNTEWTSAFAWKYRENLTDQGKNLYWGPFQNQMKQRTYHPIPRHTPVKPVPRLQSDYFNIICVTSIKYHTEIKMYPEFICIFQVKAYFALDSN